MREAKIDCRWCCASVRIRAGLLFLLSESVASVLIVLVSGRKLRNDLLSRVEGAIYTRSTRGNENRGSSRSRPLLCLPLLLLFLLLLPLLLLEGSGEEAREEEEEDDEENGEKEEDEDR